MMPGERGRAVSRGSQAPRTCMHVACTRATAAAPTAARTWLQRMRSSGCVATQMMPCERITPSSWPRLFGLGFRLGLALRLG